MSIKNAPNPVPQAGKVMLPKVNRYILQMAVILGILIIIFVTLSIMSDEFLSLTNMNNVARQVALVVITGCGVTLLMIGGNIDLSVGSTLAFSCVLCAKLAAGGMPIVWASVLAIFAGCLVGGVNALTVVKLKLTPVIATLGTMYVVRGLAFILCDGKTISAGLPSSFTALGTGYIGPIPTQLIITGLLVVLFTFIERKTVFGKYEFAIGGNKTAAKLSGINVNGIQSVSYIVVGALAGLSGVILGSRLGVGQANVGMGFEFDVIVAVVLGGTSLAGGEGSVIGMAIGALIIGFLGNGLNLLGVQTFYQSVFKGIVLVGAVILDNSLRTRIK